MTCVCFSPALCPLAAKPVVAPVHQFRSRVNEDGDHHPACIICWIWGPLVITVYSQLTLCRCCFLIAMCRWLASIQTHSLRADRFLSCPHRFQESLLDALLIQHPGFTQVVHVLRGTPLHNAEVRPNGDLACKNFLMCSKKLSLGRSCLNLLLAN